MKGSQERTQDPLEMAKRTRTNAKCKFTSKCNAFVELSKSGQQLLVIQEKINDICEAFKILDKANDSLIELINETAPHQTMDNLFQDCDSYVEEVELSLDKIRGMYASYVSENLSKSSQIHVKP